ncbi:MAG: leucine-rich repeat-containing protein kinase family protein [Chthoniobacteraceae bacterium]
MDTLSQLRAGRLAGTTRLDLSCGLTSFPREIFDLADTLEVLNVTNNRLSELPQDLGRLRRLRILFCSANEFTELPAVLGECENLRMIGFKSNRIEAVPESAFPPSLRWLILTDNRIRRLPVSIGRCGALQKLMLAGNHLEDLPDEMAACTNLELVRLAANRFQSLPAWLLSLPRLSWLAASGNPCSSAPRESTGMTSIDWADIELDESLGEGASGMIYRARCRSVSDSGALPVAVKVFKGAVTSDGFPESELAAWSAAGAHPNLIGLLGRIENHPEGACGLVMSLVDSGFGPLASPPDFESCTRDLYPDDRRFDLTTVLRLAIGVSSAAERLHARGIMHGDLYAHNVLWNPDGTCLLGDFGAATFYPPAASSAMERIEVRAFGCLLEELVARIVDDAGKAVALDALRSLHARCITTDVGSRPSFAEVSSELDRLARW